MSTFDPVMVGPSKFERYSKDAYFTLDAPMCIDALIDAVGFGPNVLEPAAGRGHLVVELKGYGLSVTATDLHAFKPIADDLDIRTGYDLMAIDGLAGYDAIVTNLPYDQQDAMLRHLLPIAHRDQCAVAVLTRAAWHLPKRRRALVHTDRYFQGVVTLPRRPWWSEDRSSAPRHDFVWCVWGSKPRGPGYHPEIFYPDERRS